MEKRVSVRTSSGTKRYKVSESGGAYRCMKYDGSFFGGWDEIGKAKSLEDALAIIKSHAQKYGSVYSVNID